jgi:branched-subunit amino acid aminotransferase/4-amino-4-deoxychorismate lyase
MTQPTPQLYALTAAGPRPLPVPPGAADFTDLYAGLDLGVYSVIRTFAHNRFFQLDHHLARTVNSMRLLGWDYQLDEARLRRAIHDLCTAYPASELRVRIDILAAPATALGSDSRDLIALMPFTPPPASLYTDGVALGYATGLHRANPLAKTAGFADARKQATAQSTSGNVYEYLMTNDQGQILEATSANFYAVRDGMVYTAGEGVLEGVTRRIVLDLVAAAEIPLQWQAVPVGDVPLLAEAMISSSSRGIVPAVRIGDQVIGDGRPGPITQQLIAAYNAYVAAHLKTALDR